MVPRSAYISSSWPKIEFSLFLIGEILSIPCYIFIVYHTLTNKRSRQSLHNHVILILLFYNFLQLILDLPMTIGYSRLGFVSPFSHSLCLLLQFINFGIWYGGIFLMFWTSVERHILVFHSNLVRTTQKRLLFHYIPLLFFSLYTPILYFYLIFLYPCNHVFIDNGVRCGKMCYANSLASWFDIYDSIVNYIAPLLLIAIFSIVFIVRFVKQRRRLQQATTWRQCRNNRFISTLISIREIMIVPFQSTFFSLMQYFIDSL
ncbi:unnamed protein product [Adineta steineri]|uniref:G-protein coupled receptors family 1 profile domain-containing protein n=1 Tax=Adineta steineri TaxID=433720 RepID=A0A819CWG2_9BILA|nr:unnamed protein product [Adineta steineri]CAF3818478.1 unnamed protein product [Adineta steineri]